MISVTPLALERLKEVLQKQGLPEAGLRVFVAPGGCSGFQYGMTLEERAEDGDEIIENEGVRVFIDPFSLMYLAGSEIDYNESLMGGGFTVLNPNAVKSCSCGQSFDTADKAGAPKPCSTR
jgi:iron-sulfur cluster assembly protein